MELNRRPPRPDISYISRRRKQTPTPATAAPAASAAAHRAISDYPSSGSPSFALTSSPTLTLDRGNPMQPNVQGGAATPRERIDAASWLFPAPALRSLRHFSDEIRVARLDARQSGIGTLVVSGAQSVAWEDTNCTTGAENVHGAKAGSRVPTSGNRPLVAFHEGTAVITLRHIQQLRRAIFISGETPLTVEVYGGAAAVVLPRGSEKAILYISRIGTLLELRVDYLAVSKAEDLWAQFGFRMTVPVVSTQNGTIPL